MGRSDLHHTCSKAKLDKGVCNNRDLPICKRKSKLLSDDILISLVFRVYCNSHVSEHCLRSCGCNSDPPRAIGIWVSYVIEFSRYVLILNFIIRQGCSTLGAVVYKIFSFIYQASFIEGDESLPYSL